MRIKARISRTQLAREAKLDIKTVNRAEDGLPVQDIKLATIVDLLNSKLSTSYTLDEIEGIVMR
jgi:DNA-binding XRE family transcriptional regulator